jgi:hypothetical protein
VRGGAHIWIDPLAADVFFMSHALGKALKAAKVDKAFQLTACRVLEVA